MRPGAGLHAVFPRSAAATIGGDTGRAVPSAVGRAARRPVGGDSDRSRALSMAPYLAQLAWSARYRGSFLSPLNAGLAVASGSSHRDFSRAPRSSQASACSRSPACS